MIGRAFGFKLGRFGVVGVISTFLYIVIATIGARWTPFPILAVNAVAFVVSGIWGYLGHYYLTFRSDAAHGSSVLRFLVLFALGYVASSAIVFVNQRLGLPPEIGTVIVAVFLPLMNFGIMQLWVFTRRGSQAAPGEPIP